MQKKKKGDAKKKGGKRSRTQDHVKTDHGFDSKALRRVQRLILTHVIERPKRLT
jgi:hypothetical protein